MASLRHGAETPDGSPLPPEFSPKGRTLPYALGLTAGNTWVVTSARLSILGSVNLKEWAAVTGVSYATARQRYESGTLPVPAYRLGRLIMVGEPLTGASTGAG